MNPPRGWKIYLNAITDYTQTCQGIAVIGDYVFRGNARNTAPNVGGIYVYHNSQQFNIQDVTYVTYATNSGKLEYFLATDGIYIFTSEYDDIDDYFLTAWTWNGSTLAYSATKAGVLNGSIIRSDTIGVYVVNKADNTTVVCYTFNGVFNAGVSYVHTAGTNVTNFVVSNGYVFTTSIKNDNSETYFKVFDKASGTLLDTYTTVTYLHMRVIGSSDSISWVNDAVINKLLAFRFNGSTLSGPFMYDNDTVDYVVNDCGVRNIKTFVLVGDTITVQYNGNTSLEGWWADFPYCIVNNDVYSGSLFMGRYRISTEAPGAQTRVIRIPTE